MHQGGTGGVGDEGNTPFTLAWGGGEGERGGDLDSVGEFMYEGERHVSWSSSGVVDL